MALLPECPKRWHLTNSQMPPLINTGAGLIPQRGSLHRISSSCVIDPSARVIRRSQTSSALGL